MEFDARGLIGSAISLIFVGIMWLTPMWQDSLFFTWEKRLFMSVVIIIVGYFITIKMLDS